VKKGVRKEKVLQKRRRYRRGIVRPVLNILFPGVLSVGAFDLL